MPYGTKLNYKKEDYIGIVKLCNPPLNLIDDTFYPELEAIQQEIAADRELKGIVILAEGKAFSAGIDLNYLKRISSGVVKEKLEWMQGLYSYWSKLAIPVIAGIHGYCFGLATELIAGVDLRIASKSAIFALPEVQLGLSPDVGGTTRTTKLVGIGQTKKIIMACEKIDANEAYRIGLIEYLVEDDQLEKSAIQLAQKIAGFPPSAVRFAKKGINLAAESSTEAGLLFEQAQSTYCCGTADIKEAVSAYVEKRKPDFKDQ